MQINKNQKVRFSDFKAEKIIWFTVKVEGTIHLLNKTVIVLNHQEIQGEIDRNTFVTGNFNVSFLFYVTSKLKQK